MNPVIVRIMAVVGIIIGFVFMGLLYGYNEQLYASLSPHCNINSERVVTVRDTDNTANNFDLTQNGTTSTLCSPPAHAVGGAVANYAPASTARWETPNGTAVTVVTSSSVATAIQPTTALVTTNIITGGRWEAQIGLEG